MLREHGDALELDDGRTLRLLVQSDQDWQPFEEIDCYGSIYAVNRWGNGDRPSECDGNAEKLSILHDVVWWQPPIDGPKRGEPGFAGFRQLVIDLASFGGHVVTVEVLQGEDAYHNAIVVDVASLSGIDSLDGGYLEEVIGELLAELGVEIPAEAVSA